MSKTAQHDNDTTSREWTPPSCAAASSDGAGMHLEVGQAANIDVVPAGPGAAELGGLFGVNGQDGALLEAPLQQQDAVLPDPVELLPAQRVARLLRVHASLHM